MISIDDVLDARRRIAATVPVSELRFIEALGVWGKLECGLPTGSFKVRGATNAIEALRPRGVVTGSSGNYGLALAHAARQAGAERVEVVVPDGFSPLKRDRMEASGAHVVVAGTGNSERDATARRLADEHDLLYLPSHDSPLVFAGHGTMGLELVDQLPGLEAVVVPIGAGGMIAGVATAIDALAPHVSIIGVEPQAGDDTVQSLAAGRRIEIDTPDTICDAVRAQVPGELTFPIIQALVDDVVTVTDTEAQDAMRALAEEGIVVEPTGALAVAAARNLALGPQTVCVLSGGNISPEMHRQLIA